MSLVSKVGKAIAHPALGILPEQPWLDEHISWYDLNKGVHSNAAIECLSGFGYLTLGFATNFRFTGDSFPLLVLASYMAGDGYARLHQKYGTIALQIPWDIGKGTCKAIKNLYQKYNSSTTNNSL